MCAIPLPGSSSSAEAQPFCELTHGITLAHNGNLTNSGELADELYRELPPYQHQFRLGSAAQYLCS